MISPVNYWLHVEPLQKDEFDESTAGRVLVKRENELAGDLLGINVVPGLVLIVEPSLIMKVGTEHFIKATKDSIYAVEE